MNVMSPISPPSLKNYAWLSICAALATILLKGICLLYTSDAADE